MFDFSSNFFRFESDIIRWIHLEIIKKRAVAMKKIISNRSWAEQFFFFFASNEYIRYLQRVEEGNF